MRTDELAQDLADFWFSALAEAGWEARLQTLNQIHAQLLADIESRAEYDAVSPLFVAALIDRLGAPLVESDAQAQIYACSNNDGHRDAAKVWSYRDAIAPAVGEQDQRLPC